MKKIKRLRDKEKQGFVCMECGRNLKKAYSIDGFGVYGSECVYRVVGSKYSSEVKKQDNLFKIWDKIINNPKMYSLDKFIKIKGSLKNVEDDFFQFGQLQ